MLSTVVLFVFQSSLSNAGQREKTSHKNPLDLDLLIPRLHQWYLSRNGAAIGGILGSVGKIVWAGSLSLSSLSLLATAGPMGMALLAGCVQSSFSDEEEQKRFSTEEMVK